VTRRASGSEQGESGNAWKAPGVEREDAVVCAAFMLPTFYILVLADCKRDLLE